MTKTATLSKECAEHAIVQRLFRASMDVHSALSLVCEESTAAFLRQAIGQLDDAIKQVQSRALALPRPDARHAPVNTLREPSPRAPRQLAPTAPG